MFVALGLVVGLAACSAEPSVEVEGPEQVEVALPAETTQQLQDAVTAAMTATGSSGAVVGVWAPWSGSWVAGLGTQRPGGGAAVTTDMLFPAGKVTRAMTCDVLFAVAAEGKVDLDDSVASYLTGAPDISEVTLRQLCDGTSGIGSYTPQLLPLWLSNPTRTWDARELASYGRGQPGSPVGSAYSDSDAAYVLLGLALERATGMRAADLFQNHVAAPLGLEATALRSATAGVAPNTLRGYQSLPGEDGTLDCAVPTEFTDLSPSVGFTDSGAVTTITELGHYAKALATGALLADGVERFDDRLPAYAGAPAWNTATGGTYQVGSLIGQYGAIPGYLTAAYSDPETGLTVAVVLNNSANGAGIGAFLAWELAAIASKAPAASGKQAPEAGLPWTAEQYHEEIAKRAVCAAPEE